MAIDIVARALAVSGKQSLENYYTKTESDAKYSQATNLENGTGTGSLVQKRLKSDGATWTTAKAYQGASTALGGSTQAGRTEDEFNAYFWDSSTNKPINGGKGKNSDGKILDNNGLTYEKSYSFSIAEGENTKALGRSSHSEGNATQAIGDCAHSEGLNTKAEGYASHTEGAYTEAYYTGSHAEGDHTKTYREYQHVEGTYNAYKSNALFIVGNGTSDTDRKNAFEVLQDGRAKVQSAPVQDDDVVRKGDLVNIGGGTKIYKHQVKAWYNHDDMYTDYIEYTEYRTNNTQITDLGFFHGKYCYAEFNSNDGKVSYGIVAVALAYDNNFGLTGVVGTSNGTAEGIYGLYEFQDILDTVTEM